MAILRFEILGRAQGLDRSRQAANGHRFDSAKNRNNKAFIRLKAEAAAENAGVALPIPPYKTGYMLALDIEVVPPKSYTRKKLREIDNGEWRPLSKPDVDNVLKLYLDALNGCVIDDDRYVTSVMITRKYSKIDKVVCHLSWQEADDA